MALTFRTARLADVDAIVAGYAMPHAAAFLYAPSETHVRAAIEKPEKNTLFVVERNDEVVASLLLVRNEPWLAEIRTLVASETNVGLGSFAIREILRYAFDVGRVHRLFLEVVATNVGARRLYERFGFVIEGTWRDGFQNDDGTYEDLCAYGLLDHEYRARRGD